MSLPKGAASKVIRDAVDGVTGSQSATAATVASHTTTLATHTTALGTLKVVAAPASAAATGVAGSVAFDTGFVYYCTATNTWKRVAIATW